MFYAHFVLSKKGPLARIWLAAHWDKKLTKAHVFETNIDSSVDAILQPKVKLALRTSGHLLLGVVRIYSRKAKYLLADCNEAFVKIKMAFRPGVVDLPEENREAAVTSITLQENFHDFDTTLADLNDIDVQAQFAVNQSRPEEITMREDLGNITLVGDDGFGDVGFDEREIMRDDSHMVDSLYKSPEPASRHSLVDDKDKTIESSLEKPMDVDLQPPVVGDDFGGAVDDGFVGGADDDDDDDDDDNFGGGVDHEFFGDNFMDAGGLFEDPPMADVSLAPEVEAQGTSGSTEPVPKPTSDTATGEAESAQAPEPAAGAAAAAAPPAHEQTTLVHNEEEEFALEPIDVTSVQGTEKKGKRKRKLIVDDQKGIPSESMKMQLSDTSDIVSTLDLAPPTKKLMHWKETGGVEKLFALSGRPIHSKAACKLYSRNLVTKPMKEEEEVFEEERPEFESPEVPRAAEPALQEETAAPIQEQSTLIEEPSLADVSTRSRRSNRSVLEMEPPQPPQDLPPPLPLPGVEPLNTTDLLSATAIGEGLVDMPAEPTALEHIDMGPKYLDDEPPSIAPFSVPPPSVAPPSVAPPPAFEDLEPETEAMPETEEQEERRMNKRSQQMQYALEAAFRFSEALSFKDLTRRHNRKQVCSKFYTLLVLKKLEAVNVQQTEAFGDITLTKGPRFGEAV